MNLTLSMLEIVTELLNAKSEDEVDPLLTNEFFKKGTWKPFGDELGNYGLIENQQAHPVASLAEKITNAVDAVLLKECKLRNIDPTSKAAPESMQEAVAEFFGDYEERQNKKQELAKLIRIQATGPLRSPNLFIIDQGEGQRPEDFESTFLSLLESKTRKKDINFTQGRYYMGGTGVLPYCGEKGYGLILSRSAVFDGTWGWTIVRKNRKEERYEYFLFDDQVPSFESSEFWGLKDGTIIKLFNYALPHPSTITTDLRDDLDLFMF